MEATAQLEMFSNIAEKAPRRGFLRRYLEVTVQHGALVPLRYVAEALDVSRQRVHQLVASGQLETVDVGDRVFVAANKLEEFVKVERKTGYNLSRRWIYLGDGAALKKS
jgi:hypothetical protein